MLTSACVLWLGHGNDPKALPWFTLLADWILAVCALACCIFLLRKFLLHPNEDPEGREGAPEGPPIIHGPESAGWVVVALGFVAATTIWITRQSLYEGVIAAPPAKVHKHMVFNGGQVAMWGDYHVEIARHISGEYRLWFTDAYGRNIGARFFKGSILPRNPKTTLTEENSVQPLDYSLDDLYLFAILPTETKSVQVRLEYPSGSIKLNFTFDESVGRRTLLEWCGSPNGIH